MARLARLRWKPLSTPDASSSAPIRRCPRTMARRPVRATNWHLVTSGNPLGRVFRVVSDDTPSYDQDRTTSMVVARARRGDLLVVFDDPGKMRQVITANQTFGYLPFSVRLHREDMMPAEIHNSRAHSTLPDPAATEAAAASTATVAAAAPGSAGGAGGCHTVRSDAPATRGLCGLRRARLRRHALRAGGIRRKITQPYFSARPGRPPRRALCCFPVPLREW